MQFKLNESIFRCTFCGKRCNGGEIEQCIDRTITCSKCRSVMANWEHYVSKHA